MRKLFTIILLAILCVNAMAYDFSAVCSTGQTLYYNINSDTEVEVTSENTSSPYYSTSPTGNLEIPESVVYNGITYSVTGIGNHAFRERLGLTSVAIPNSVTDIGDSAFKNCSELTSITIPNSVTHISNYAFESCTGLVSVSIPDSITNIGDGIFYGCDGLTEPIYNAECLVYFPRGYATEYAIPDGIKQISGQVFYNCSELTDITIPNSVTLIGNYAFYLCTGLTGTFTIPNSVTSIGVRAFSGCSGLSSITIPNSVTSIGWEAFDGTSWYETQPDGILYTAGWCIGYKGDAPTGTLVIEDGTIGIASKAFTSCTELTGTLTIPSSITSIGENAFMGCSGLTGVNYAGDIADWCGISFESTSANPLYQAHNLYINDELVTDLVIPETVIEIKDYAFNKATCLSSVYIPSSVTSIGEWAFDGCTGLTGDLTISNSVVSIGEFAFGGCSEITSVTISNSVDSIGWRAFDECTGITSVRYTGDLSGWCRISFDEWASNPLEFAHNLYINDVLVTNLVIPEDVTEIKQYAFYKATCLTSLTIPNSVTSIGDDAFYDCSGLTGNLTLPDHLIKLGKYAFWGCSGLTGTLTIPNSVTSIGEGAFYDCSGLSGALVFPNSGTRIGKSAFRNCSGLESVTTGDFVTNISDFTFYGCNGLRTITIGNSVVNIGGWTFSGCENITDIYIKANTPPTIDNDNSNSFTSTTYSTATLWAPCGLTDTYSSADGWSDFTNIQEHFQYALNVSSENEQQGTANITQEPTCSDNNGIITATPATGYRFLQWNDGNTDNPRTIVVTSDSTFTAGFRAIHTITASAGENGSISPSGEITLDEGENQSFTIAADEQYRIASVMVDDVDATGQLVDGVYAFENVTADHTIEATFEEIPTYTISVLSNNDAYGSVSGGGTYDEGTQVIITATPYEGYRFVSWNDSITDNPRTITVTSDSTFVANFEQIPESHTITVMANDDAFGMVSGGGTYDEGTQVVINATPYEGYLFVSWNDSVTDNPRTITVTSDSTFVAIFEAVQIQQYTITVLPNNEEYGIVSGSGTYYDGDTVVILAMPNSGYNFVSWDDGYEFNPRAVVVTSDSTFIADFIKCEITQTIDTVVPNFVTVGDHTFYSTGNYAFSIPSETGCDTIYDINLRVLAEPVYDIGPNPTEKILNITSDSFISYVEFYSPTGQLVMRKEVNGYEAEFDMEGLVDGVYILRIYGEESSLPSVSKVVKE